MGAFIVVRKGWRWTQWTMLFFCAFSILLMVPFGRESYHAILKRRRAKELGRHVEPSAPLGAKLRLFLTITILRPVQMLVTEPLVGLVCLYVSTAFATLYTFFTAVPYVFQTVYGFTPEQAGLVFLSVVVGCLLGTLTTILCDMLLYRRQVPRHPPHMVPPEYRLYPAMIGSLGLPAGLFWLAWAARADVSWASPAVALVPFAWGNLCLFVGMLQFNVDTYTGTVVASASSANSLSRYGLGGAFPLFALQSESAHLFFPSPLDSRCLIADRLGNTQCTPSWVFLGPRACWVSSRWCCCRCRGSSSSMARRSAPGATTRPRIIRTKRHPRHFPSRVKDEDESGHRFIRRGRQFVLCKG